MSYNRKPYERPMLMLIGTVQEVTQGPNTGGTPDGTSGTFQSG